MSVRTMARVWELSKHSGTHLLMMLAIADFADDDGRAYPSVSTLATKCRTTPRNANLVLAVLKASGELSVLANQGPKGCNVYRVRLRTEGVKESTGVKKPSGVKPASSTPEESFLPPCRDLPGTPVEVFSQTITEPSVNHQEPPERAHRRKRATAAPTPDGVGQQVWADWLVVRKGKRVGSVTPTVLHGIRREAAKAGLSLEDALRVSVEAGWAGFRADWYANRAGSSPRTSPKAISTGFEDVDYTVGLDSAGRLQRERSDGH